MQHITSADEMTQERIKEIALHHFYSFYVQRSMTNMLEHVSPGVRWIGSKESFIARNKREFASILQKELDNIPSGCAVKTVLAEVVQADENCYSINGVLELRIPQEKAIYYSFLCFTMILVLEQGSYSIVSIHTSFQGVLPKEQALQGERGATCYMAEDMYHQNPYDTLTGLHTIDYFKEEVRGVLEESGREKYALICTNVSHFERVNNMYGLKIADQILLDLAKRITDCILPVKVCCRSVADHFLALITYESERQMREDLVAFCDEFGRKMQRYFPNARLRLGIGVYRIEDKEEEVERMVECANTARKSLRLNKSECVVMYDTNIFTQMERIKEIEHSMKPAMRDREFKVYLQPKYNLESGEIIGAEALSRWIHKDGSMEYPDEFIPIFEKNGFIVDLDFYMLEGVCEMLSRRLQGRKKCVPVSINQSRILLNEENYPERFAKMLRRYNIPAEYLELELTERIFKEDLSDMARIMAELKKLGIRWSIDDFGTGYSSLNLLKELPVDIIKIDKSFLDETETSETSKIIIRKTVELTQELSKSVVCEGVETESQADYLRGIQCDVAQGYLYAKPMPMNEFEKLLDGEMET